LEILREFFWVILAFDLIFLERLDLGEEAIIDSLINPLINLLKSPDIIKNQ
jgi:hypothetical protein